MIRCLTAIGCGGIHSIICSLMLLTGNFSIGITGFIWLMSSLWIVHISFPIMIRTGINRRFNDPSMGTLMIVWAIFAVTVTLFFMKNQQWVMLAFYPLILVFGAFGLDLKQFIRLGVLTIIAVAAVILIGRQLQMDAISTSMDGVTFISFSFLICAFIVVNSQIIHMHLKLRNQRQKLTNALEKIKEMAVTDELTGLCNRRHIMHILMQQKAMVNRGEQIFSICFFDLDAFKKINDKLGHQTGDQVLKAFADIVTKQLRVSDHFARFGGEEFILVLVGAGLEHAVKIAERIRKIVGSYDFSAISPALTLTFSGGVAQIRRKERIEDLISRADKALYIAKNNGRNKIVAA